MSRLTLENIQKQHDAIKSRIHITPVHAWDTPLKDKMLPDCDVIFKLELLQRTGTFKIRGALTVMDHLSNEEKARGIVAGTGGNHGLAVAHAAQAAGVSATVVVPDFINPLRLERLQKYPANIIKMPNIPAVMEEMERIAQDEGRVIMHPFENPYISLGTSTLGLEFVQQVSDLDVVIVPIGGGGLASGVGAAVKLINPACVVYGVEPAGAPSMSLSRKAGEALPLEKPPRSIADSLSSPYAAPYSFDLCQKYVDDIVLIEDSEMQKAMRLLFDDVKLVSEPAGATATAGLLGPLYKRCIGKKVGVLVCGSNIDLETFYRYIKDINI